MLALLAAASLIQTAPVPPPEAAPAHSFVLTGAGRFAVLADLSTIGREGDIAEMRALQVSDNSFTVAGVAYWGGWSRWRFDCAAHTADRLDFASLRESGVEGPSTLEPSPAYPAAPGGDAAELLEVACSTTPRTADVTTLEAAVRLGRAAVAGDLDPPR